MRVKIDGELHKVRHHALKKGKCLLVLEEKYLEQHIKVEVSEELKVGEPQSGLRFTSGSPQKQPCVIVLDEE